MKVRKHQIKINPPTRPFKDMLEAKRGQSLYNRERCGEAGFYPCLECLGAGKVIAPYETADPVEGYKMADRIECPVCRGKCEGTKEAFMVWYNDRLHKWKNDMCKFRREVKRVKELQKLIVPEDINLIKKYL